MASDGLMKVHAHCKEQMMKAQVVPILKSPSHAFCPHASYSCLCWSSAQEWRLRISPGLLCKVHCQNTGSVSPRFFSREKSKSSSFSGHTLALDYTTGVVVKAQITPNLAELLGSRWQGGASTVSTWAVTNLWERNIPPRIDTSEHVKGVRHPQEFSA